MCLFQGSKRSSRFKNVKTIDFFNVRFLYAAVELAKIKKYDPPRQALILLKCPVDRGLHLGFWKVSVK